MTIVLVECTENRHSEAVLAILNRAIETSTALYDYHPRPLTAMTGWFGMRRDAGIPVIGVEDSSGRLLGFATWGPFRAFAAFKYSAEHSIYVHETARAAGLGSRLLAELIERARQHELHALIGGIDATNIASRQLHERFGFLHVGTIVEAGYKFGTWRDLAFYQLLLDTPSQPVED